MKDNTSIRLKQIMSERNLRQVDILNMCEPYCKEHKVKLSKNYLSQYVSGKVAPSKNTLLILAKALNVNDAWLAGFDVPMGCASNKSNDTLDYEILKKFHKLNHNGKMEAINRVNELGYIPSYIDAMNEE